jgi:hypothetical protein
VSEGSSGKNGKLIGNEQDKVKTLRQDDIDIIPIVRHLEQEALLCQIRNWDYPAMVTMSK